MSQSDKRALIRTKYEACLGHAGIARRLERATWNRVVKEAREQDVPKYWDNQVFRRRYTTKALHILFNLNNPATPDLKRMVMAGADLTDDDHVAVPHSLQATLGMKQQAICDALLQMTPQQMHPELWREAIEMVERKAARGRPEDIKKDHQGLFQCRHCKSMRTTYTLVQTRSADEPSSAFVLCADCRKRWKMSA